MKSWKKAFNLVRYTSWWWKQSKPFIWLLFYLPKKGQVKRKTTNRKNTYLVPLSIQERKVIIGCYHSLFMELLVTCQDCKLSLNKCKLSLKSCKRSWKDIIIFLFVARNMLRMDHVEIILNVIVEIQLARCNTTTIPNDLIFLQCCSSVF